jgi:2-amino-4-hydroxy-6-hydroxymethyldihydropteridine diphosphokinase
MGTMLAMPSSTGYLGLGSNLGDRLAHLRNAVARLDADSRLDVLRRSSVYETAPWGYESTNRYYNAVISIAWDGTPSQLQILTHQVEHELWRMKKRNMPQQPYEDRTIDIDILWLDGVVANTATLTIPHPQAHLRAFVLAPWCELAPELELRGKAISQILAELPSGETDELRKLEQANL